MCLVGADDPFEGGAFDLESYLARTHIRVATTVGEQAMVDRPLGEMARPRAVAYTSPYFAAAALAVIGTDLVVTVGLGLFGVLFAVNSSVHSYLVLAYAGSEKAAEDVGFYYAANAAGRFGGTLLSGLLYGWGGLAACLAAAALALVACWGISLAFPLRAKEP